MMTFVNRTPWPIQIAVVDLVAQVRVSDVGVVPPGATGAFQIAGDELGEMGGKMCYRTHDGELKFLEGNGVNADGAGSFVISPTSHVTVALRQGGTRTLQVNCVAGSQGAPEPVGADLDWLVDDLTLF